MVNAPLRPPNRSTERRTPKGPTVARPRAHTFRADLTKAASVLRETANRPELAETVEAALAPAGWTLLRDTEVPVESTGPKKSMSLSMREDWRDEIKKRAAAVEAIITDDVDEAFSKYLAGELADVPKRRRHTRGHNYVGMSVRPNPGLWQEVTNRGASASQVAIDYLLRKYEVGPYAQGQDGEVLPAGPQQVFEMSTALRTRLREALDAAGEMATDEVHRAYKAFIAGDFTPTDLSWPDRSDIAGFAVRPNADLDKQVREAAAARADELGWKPRPSQIAVSYLMERYGIALDTK